MRRAVLHWLTAHPQRQLGGPEPADFFSSRYADVAGEPVSREEFDQAVAWRQSGGFVTEKPRKPAEVRLITITHKGMICGEQYDGDVTKFPYGP
jgi:hypothetical protein